MLSWGRKGAVSVETPKTRKRTCSCEGTGCIIVILCAILWFVFDICIYPLIPRPPIRNRRGLCARNLQRAGKALLLYADDYGGTLPSSAIVSRSAKWRKTDFEAFATERGTCPAKGAPHTWAEALYRYRVPRTYGENDAKKPLSFFCPSDRTSRTDRVSYWWKVALDKAWYGEGCSRSYRRVSSFARAARCTVLYERNAWHDSVYVRKGLVDGATIWRLHLDGHVMFEPLTNATSGDPINCVANSDGEPMYFNASKNGRVPDGKPATYVDPGTCWDE